MRLRIVSALVASCLIDISIAAAQIQTLQTDYTVNFSVGVDGQAAELASVENGKFRFDAKNARAIYLRTSKLVNGEEWVVQDLFDKEMSLSVTWQTQGKLTGATKHASGRPDQVIADWWSFLGGHNLAPVSGHLLLGKQGCDISEMLQNSQSAPDGGPLTESESEVVFENYRIRIERQPEFGNSISKLTWSRLGIPDSKSESIEPISGGFFVETFESVSDCWVPVKYHSTVTNSGGQIKLPGNLKVAGQSEHTVPGKTFTAEVSLANLRVNAPLSDLDFKVQADEPMAIVNWNAPHIRHVLVKNRIVPEVDALAAGLIDNSAFVRPISRMPLIYVNLVLLCLLPVGVLLFRRKKSTTTVICLAALLQGNPAFASGDASSLARVEANGPYCGVYSVLAGLRAIGVTVAPETAIHQRYIGSYRGSTGKELAKLAADCGSRPQVFEKLSLEHLEFSDRPVVLHFKSMSQLESYNHWVTFLGTKDSLPVIYDPPEQLRSMSWQELSSRWDGIGIVLSNSDSQKFDMRFATVMRFAKSVWLVVMVFGLAVVCRHLQTRLNWLRSGSRAFGVYVMSVVCLIAAVQFVSADGIVSSSVAIDTMARRHFPLNLPEVSSADVKSLVDKQHVCILDARYSTDYDSGTIPGALSFPVDSTIPYRETLLKQIAKTRPIVVFCASNTCTFSDQVAMFLIDNGFTDVSIFRGGYVDWLKASDER